MGEKFEIYINLMSFISRAIGPAYELSLIDVRQGKNKLIAMEYGDISGRKVGEDFSSLASQILEYKDYEHSDFIVNKTTYSKTGKALRSSMFFIKNDNNELEAIMTISFDDSEYEELGKRIMLLCHPDHYIENRDRREKEGMLKGDLNQGEKITIEDSVDSIVESELKALSVPVERLTQDEKIAIVKNLDQKGVFMIKGAVNILSKKLEISQASVYRYINIARDED